MPEMYWWEDKEEERVADVSCQTICINGSFKPESDKGWQIIFVLHKKNHRSMNHSGRKPQDSKQDHDKLIMTRLMYNHPCLHRDAL